MAYQTLEYIRQGNRARINFNRPEIHNAFNGTVIDELSLIFDEVAKDDGLRVVVLSGNGKSFCAGADLNWMRAVKDQAFEANLAESNKLADLFYKIYTCKFPVIGRINGAAIGGGTGFVAVCDIAIAADNVRSAFPKSHWASFRLWPLPICRGWWG